MFLQTPKDFPQPLPQSTVLIAFAGPSGVGKDTAAKLLSAIISRNTDEMAETFSFADRLKYACGELFNLTYNHFDKQGLKNTPLVYGRSPKEIAQFLGTEVIRNLMHPDFHVHGLHWVRLDYSEAKYHIITDLRFQNEYDYVQSQGGHVIQLTRDTEAKGIPGHASDKCVFEIEKGDRYHEIDNPSTSNLSDLDNKLTNWCLAHLT